MASKKQASDSPTQSVGETKNSNGTREVSTEWSNFGEIAYCLHCSILPEKEDKVLSLGILHVAQRAPASQTEKELAGYVKRPDGFKRDSIGYSESIARQFEAIMAKRFMADEDGNGITVRVETKKYEPTTPEKAYGQAKQTLREAQARGSESVVRLVANVGYTGNGELNVENVEFLQAIDAELVRRRATLLS